MNQSATSAIHLWMLVFFGAVLPATVPAANRPNVVFILADDLGYRELGCFGQRKIRTPHLDRLAAEGLKLTRHYSGNAVCAPSRCVLLTGKHPGHAFIRDNKSTPPEGQWPLPAEELTLAEVLRAAGYATGVFGKWGLGGPDSAGEPLSQGFDHFYGYNCQAVAHSHYPASLWSDRETVALGNNPPVPGHAPLPDGANPADPRSYDSFVGTDYASDRIHEQAVQFIHDHHDAPFFLFYTSTLPHVALQVPPEELKPYLDLGWNDPPFTGANGGYTPHFTPRAAYAAMISHLDRQVGSLMSTLDELGLTDNTIVIFSADNGTAHLGAEVDHEFFESVGELRGLKGSLYEGGVRVPTIVRWPGHTPVAGESDFVSGFEDWLPTIASITGTEVAPGSDGVNLVPTLEGRDQPSREFLYREFPGYGGQQSVQVGRWKLVRQNMDRRDIRSELYDLESDISEARDIAVDHPQVVSELEAILLREHVPSADFPLRPVDVR